MSLENVRTILSQAKELRTVDWIYFEGGEPFLYYATLLEGAREASNLGFRVGIVSNCYWATTAEDALEYLRPFAGLVQDLSISDDLYHSSDKLSQHARNACSAAEKLRISVEVIGVAQPEEAGESALGQLPSGKPAVMIRGRAAEKLSKKVPQAPWNQFTKCTHERLQDPGRLHIDPFGNLHICQGISIDNVHDKRLTELCRDYDPSKHPIIGTLVDGGPTELVRRYNLPHMERYADACHLCYEARKTLRSRFPQTLGPDQMYGLLETHEN